MTFGHTSVLWMLAAAVPALALFWWWAWRQRRRLIDQFVPPRLQATLTVGLSPRRARVRACLVILGIAALLLALARPRHGVGTIEMTQRGLDILVAIDTSRSMLAEDAGPGLSRLRQAKLAALDLARLAQTDRVGLIAFAGSAFLQCPLTVDDEAFRQSVEALDTTIIPQGGTEPGSAINAALDAFKGEPENVRALVLFTDGEEHEAGAIEAAKRAEARALKVFTVGVGTARGEIVRVRDADGKEEYLKDSQGNVVKSSLNEPLLREIANLTGGLYLPLQGPRAMAELFTRGLDPLPRADLDSRMFDQYREQFQWPLALAILLLACEAILPERGTTRGRARAMRLVHPTFAAPGTALVLALMPFAGLASPRSALNLYRHGDFLAAEDAYEQLARERPGDARLRFNAGTAAYRAEAYQRAIDHFTETLRTPDLKLLHDAFYNLGNAQFAQGEALPEPATRQPLWEQSIQSFEAALKLNPEDPNARHNLEYARQRLEELKQQQQHQQQQQDQKQDQQQDQQQDDQKEDQQPSPGSEKKEDSKDPSASESPDPSQPNQDQDKQDSPDNEPKNNAENQPKDGESNEKKSQQGQSPTEAPDPGKDNANPANDAQPAQNNQMTLQQALRLLDAAKGEEKPVPLVKRPVRAPVFKDW